MTGLFKQTRLIITLIVLFLLGLFSVSACSGLDLFGETTPPAPAESKIVAPVESGGSQIARVLAGSPVQIQSVFAGQEVTSVELYIQPENQPERLIRGDTLANHSITQAWTPEQPGRYLVRVVGVTRAERIPLTITVEVFPSEGLISIPAPDSVADGTGLTIPTPAPRGTEIVVTPAATPAERVFIVRPTEINARSIAGPAGELLELPTPPVGATIQVLETAEIIAATPLVAPTATPVRYPPPPPDPGVPPGPTQDQLPPKIPPMCDAAQYLSEFVATDDTQRIYLPGEDDIPIKVAAGSIVHRAWRMQNVGTCTWGPGYELAFYGGRSMGSGGVAFESTFPSDLRPRNVLLDTNRLVLPEGKPNQTAVLEVLLNAPTYPGIHQSYWRMRNPQGVYFGPIVGVTMEVVRECEAEPGEPFVYGAPVVNFAAISVNGNPVGEDEGIPGAGPLPVEVGDAVRFRYTVFNHTSFQIIKFSPTRDIEVSTSEDPNSDFVVTPGDVGLYTIRLYAENGSCPVSKDIELEVRPPVDAQFVFDMIFFAGAPVASLTGSNAQFSSTVRPGTFEAQWQHIDDRVNEIVLLTPAVYERRYEDETCYLSDYLGRTLCWPGGWGDWETSRDIGATSRFSVAGGAIGTTPSGRATISYLSSPLLNELAGASAEEVDAVISEAVQAEALGCPGLSDERVQYRVVFQLAARANGQEASPARSNTVEVFCGRNIDTTVGMR
jgi:hypothetical protein